MFSIANNGVITVDAGDYFKTPLFLNAGTELEPVRYVLGANDKLQFRVLYPNQEYDDAIIKKEYTNQDLNENLDVLVIFNSDDTINLERGLYYYTARLLRPISGTSPTQYTINTVVQSTQFNIR